MKTGLRFHCGLLNGGDHVEIYQKEINMINITAKEAYETPEIIAHGTIEEMTQANSIGAVLDQNQLSGQSPLLS